MANYAAAARVYQVHTDLSVVQLGNAENTTELAAAEAARHVGPTVGVIEASDGARTTVAIGGDLEWIASYVAGLSCRFEVLEPAEVRAAVRELGARLVRDNS